jgi:hypothetical protein
MDKPLSYQFGAVGHCLEAVFALFNARKFDVRPSKSQVGTGAANQGSVRQRILAFLGDADTNPKR